MPGTDLSKMTTAKLRQMMKGATPTMKVQIATELRNRDGGSDMMPSGDLEGPMPKKMEQKKAKGGMVKKYAKGGYANCGASVKPNRMAKK